MKALGEFFFWGGSFDEKKISWVAWNKVLMPKKNGGLGIRSLLSSNQSLLAKWWWRFKIEPNALWRKIITSIFGNEGALDNSCNLSNYSGVWKQIVNLENDLGKVNVNLPSLFKIKIGNGEKTSFWHDNWVL